MYLFNSNFYENIEYYLLTYEFEGKIHMLAYIHWTADVREDSAGLDLISKIWSV